MLENGRDVNPLTRSPASVFVVTGSSDRNAPGATLEFMLLAGDIGATKTLLGLYSPAPARPTLVATAAFTTLDYDSLDAMVGEFLRPGAPLGESLDAAFGVAGPVRGHIARLTNVPWSVDAAEMLARFSFRSVALLNDLEAMACALPVLDVNELAVLQSGQPIAGGNLALIAAGTGLGEALLHHVDGRFIPSPSEGGHADFAARNETEIGLLRELTRTCGRADVERVLSGPGLVNVHRFMHPGGCPVCDPSIDPAHAPSIITRSALERQCERCVETLDLFVSVYGAEAGNLALRTMATGGVYLGGGIAPKILPALRAPGFLESFCAKEPLAALLASVPVAVILNEQAGLLGAAVRANQAAAGRT
jgi:glucokinase